MNHVYPSCQTYAAYVPSGPPPGLSEFVADCRGWQRELLWARHDKRTRRWAAQTVRDVWHTMRYMGRYRGGRRSVPKPPLEPEQLLRLRPEQAAGQAIQALAVAIEWAEGRSSDPQSDQRPSGAAD